MAREHVIARSEVSSHLESHPPMAHARDGACGELRPFPAVEPPRSGDTPGPCWHLGCPRLLGHFGRPNRIAVHIHIHSRPDRIAVPTRSHIVVIVVVVVVVIVIGGGSVVVGVEQPKAFPQRRGLAEDQANPNVAVEANPNVANAFGAATPHNG